MANKIVRNPPAISIPSFASPNSPDAPITSSTPPHPGSRTPSPPHELSEADFLELKEPSDLPALRRTHLTDGYRAGISAGKSDAEMVQKGFDTGFPIGAALGLQVGFLKGAVSRMAEMEMRESMEVELSLEALLAGEGPKLGFENIDGAEIGHAGNGPRRQEDNVGDWETVKRWTELVKVLGERRHVNLRYQRK